MSPSAPTPSAGTVDMPSTVTLHAKSKSDIYASPVRPPPHVTYDAPIAHKPVARDAFLRARVTLSYTPTLQYDQGGFLFSSPSAAAVGPDATDYELSAATDPAWIKAGVEVEDGEAFVSVVAKARGGWCDWSLAPIVGGPTELGKLLEVTLEMERTKNALMIYTIGEGGSKRTLVRKVPWVFLGDPTSTAKAWVGVYAGRPDPESEAGDEALEVKFSGLKIETMSEEMSKFHRSPGGE